MKSIPIVAIALLTLTSAAYAQTAPTEALRDAANMKAGENYPVVTYQGSKTRAEVIAELETAQKAGLVGHKAPLMPQEMSNKSRAGVLKEMTKEARQEQQSALDKSLYSGA